MVINDILGIKPESETRAETTKAAIKGVSSFLKIVFKPGLEEVGYIIKDELRYWRLNSKGLINVDDKMQYLDCNS